MATESHPIRAWVASIMAGSGVAQSASLTATIFLTLAHKFKIPFACQFSNVSADPIVSVYPSSDGGNGFDSDAMTAFSIGRVASGTGQRSIDLEGGIYAVRLQNSGPNSAVFRVLTQQVLTAYETN